MADRENVSQEESSVTSPMSVPPAALQTSDITSPPPVEEESEEESSQRRRRRTDPSSPFSSNIFSPPAPSNILPSSEIDLSSPLTFGTPSSRVGGPGSNRGATPVRPRGDLGQSQRLREINVAVLDGVRVLSS
ncbi:PREDICTED: DNA replication licensing factor mcm4-A-like [Amphimedon queenslandica]|uniref:Uncharacterized protein n=2 Tax=Amphimedon queenslandica TaxID=400682 RepID=A0AAN0K3Y0_AMPQE|nr:PREDICTED: DNA replication licensing factor mcm4-A-like [Amphimedon queenslandica]|eukprot:XP_019863863.1 PREDICTED: DNA replication licensing factor mcm4-A-like [Amphimedon queenslandica]